MIERLGRKMTLMVIAVLILVSAGIVGAIHLSIEHQIAAQAETSLAVLARNSPLRSEEAGTPPPKPDENRENNSLPKQTPPPKLAGEAEKEGNPPEPPVAGVRDDRGQPPEIRSGREAAAAGLGNSYVIILNTDGVVEDWSSERKDLYTDDQVKAIAESILAEEKETGRIGTQFYRKEKSENGTRVIVLDARLDFLSAANTLRSTILVAALACALLSVLAWLLIRRMVRPVKEAFIRQKQFVDDASHELKTPLAVISANAEVLEGEIGENEYLGYIRSEVRRTDSLVRSLLTLARMDRNNGGTEMKTFDLSHALLDVALPFESTVYEAGKTLETEIPDGVGYCGNEEMIKQLAVILLSNALKYSNENGRIRISLEEKGKQLEIRVFNTGDAIPAENMEKIFDRFWRGDPAHGKETGGHGLGLAIARGIVETHGGKISVESREGEGTAFSVTLNA